MCFASLNLLSHPSLERKAGTLDRKQPLKVDIGGTGLDWNGSEIASAEQESTNPSLGSLGGGEGRRGEERRGEVL